MMIIIIRLIIKRLTIIRLIRLTIIRLIIIRLGNLGWCPAGESLISWGEGSLLALAGNPSKDGVSIKIMVWRNFKPTPLFTSE